MLVSRGRDHTRGSPSRFWRRDQITPHRTTDKFPQSSEHRVKQTGSCNSRIHIIPEKPLTRPQITTLMLFSPVNESPSQSPALQRTTTQISPWLTPLSDTLAPGGGSPFPGNLDTSDKVWRVNSFQSNQDKQRRQSPFPKAAQRRRCGAQGWSLYIKQLEAALTRSAKQPMAGTFHPAHPPRPPFISSHQRS